MSMAKFISRLPKMPKGHFCKTSEMSVRALGTRFNVMAYHDELAQSVVLVEGLVEVQSNDESKRKFCNQTIC